MPHLDHHLATLCVHGGAERDAEGALTPPLYDHTTFGFTSTQDVVDTIDGRKAGNLYTRYGMNPTIRAVEQQLALLEGAEGALVFGAGIAAIATTLIALACDGGGGGHIVCFGDVYGGTFGLMQKRLSALGIRTTFVLERDPQAITQAITPQTKLVYFETPTNPNMEVIDIAAVAQVAHAHGLLAVVDSTFASPVNQQPLALGADIVLHSATKYLGGHSDLTGGAVMARHTQLAPIAAWRTDLGSIMAPQVAYLLARSLRSLPARVRQQNANAQAVAEFLAGHPKVRQVNYPGLPDFPTHALAQRQMRGFGGMLSFVYDGDAQQTAHMVERLKLIALAPSLGGVESLITQPVTTSHHGLTPAERAERGISDGLVRLSCGLEDAADLIADLRQALA